MITVTYAGRDRGGVGMRAPRLATDEAAHSWLRQRSEIRSRFARGEDAAA